MKRSILSSIVVGIFGIAIATSSYASNPRSPGMGELTAADYVKLQKASRDFEVMNPAWTCSIWPTEGGMFCCSGDECIFMLIIVVDGG